MTNEEFPYSQELKNWKTGGSRIVLDEMDKPEFTIAFGGPSDGKMLRTAFTTKDLFELENGLYYLSKIYFEYWDKPHEYDEFYVFVAFNYDSMLIPRLHSTYCLFNWMSYGV